MNRTRLALIAGALLLTTAIAAVGQAPRPGVNSTLNSGFNYPGTEFKATYAATVSAFAAPSSATDIVTICGSSTKTIVLRRITVGGDAATAVTTPFFVVKRSSLPAGGTGALLFGIPFDSQNGAATAVVSTWTTVPTTVGTLVGAVASRMVGLPVGTGAAISQEFNFGGAIGNDAPVVLRGTTQCAALNLNSASITGSSLAVTTEWTEE